MDVQVNIDLFRRRPVRELVALLPSEGDAIAACTEIDGMQGHAGPAQMLVGEEGLRIHDLDGSGHGYAARLWRAAAHIGSSENILHVHNDGVAHGEALISIACTRDAASAIAAVLGRHGAHAVAYFGRGTLEAMSNA